MSRTAYRNLILAILGVGVAIIVIASLGPSPEDPSSLTGETMKIVHEDETETAVTVLWSITEEAVAGEYSRQSSVFHLSNGETLEYKHVHDDDLGPLGRATWYYPSGADKAFKGTVRWPSF